MKTYKKFLSSLLIAALVLCLGGFFNPAGAISAFSWDANTVLLEHYDGSNSAQYVNGPLQYVPSFPDLAVNIKAGNWLRYELPAWPQPGAGTLEMWIYPRGDNYAIIELQWFKVDSIPSSGFIAGFDIINNKLIGGAWAEGELHGNIFIPYNAWSHVVFEWGPEGSAFFVNGKLDVFTTKNLWPHMNDPLYVYLNGWGDLDLGYIDEFRISNIARYPIPLPPSILLLGSGLLGLLWARRFRRS